MGKKKHLSSRQIEDILNARLEERFREGNVSEELAEYFENIGAEWKIPSFPVGGERKMRTIPRDTAGEARRERRGSADHPENPDLGPPSNTTPTFHGGPSEGKNPVCPHIMGGYDGGVEMGILGNWDKDEKPLTMQVLETAKQHANDPENDDSKAIFELAGELYVMQAAGAKKGANYRYVFEGGGIKFYVHSNPKGNVQPIRIRYDATGLIGRDLFHKHAETVNILESWGFTVTAEKLTRIDMQIMLLCNAEEIITPGDDLRNRIVCSAQNFAFFGKGLKNSFQTFTMGSTRFLQICTYDKRAEMFMAMKKDPEKFALMIQECFGNEWLYEEIPTTRVEFRIGRELLSAMNINTMKDLLVHENGLARYCCNSWFRVISEPKKKGHSHEQPVTERWQEVQEAFEKYFPGVEGHNEEVHRNYDKSLKCSEDHLFAQSSGCLASVVALRIGVAETVDEVKTVLYNFVTESAQKIFDRSRLRAAEAGIKSGRKTCEKIRDCISPNVAALTRLKFAFPVQQRLKLCET